jgi:hypothetical protein
MARSLESLCLCAKALAVSKSDLEKGRTYVTDSFGDDYSKVNLDQRMVMMMMMMMCKKRCMFDGGSRCLISYYLL